MSEIINRNGEVSQHPEQEGLGKDQPQSNEDIVGNTHDETMTRRQFLRVAAVTAGIAAIANTVPKSIGGQSEEAQNELVGNEYHKPETVHGVEVYGLIDSI